MNHSLDLTNVVQIAYFVNDVKAAAKKAHECFGTGPFFLYKNIALNNVTYRRRQAELDHSSAYAQAGSVMIEFTQQNNRGPSTFGDMFPDGQEGFHHVAIVVANVQNEMQKLGALGYETVTHYFTVAGNVEVAFVDCRSMFGHMVEIYQPVEALTRFYHAVATAADNWDGKNLFRTVD